jgi:hypothetical protein
MRRNANRTKQKQSQQRQQQQQQQQQQASSLLDSEVSSTSLFAGNMNALSADSDEGAAMKLETGSSSETSNNTNEQPDNCFSLHLPDFNDLVNGTNANANANSRLTTISNDNQLASTSAAAAAAAFVSPTHHNIGLSTISIGTSSIKSQYYHSTTSHIDSEGLSVANDSEYESLFSDDSFLSMPTDNELVLNDEIMNNNNNDNNNTTAGGDNLNNVITHRSSQTATPLILNDDDDNDDDDDDDNDNDNSNDKPNINNRKESQSGRPPVHHSFLSKVPLPFANKLKKKISNKNIMRNNNNNTTSTTTTTTTTTPTSLSKNDSNSNSNINGNNNGNALSSAASSFLSQSLKMDADFHTKNGQGNGNGNGSDNIMNGNKNKKKNRTKIVGTPQRQQQQQQQHQDQDLPPPPPPVLDFSPAVCNFRRSILPINFLKDKWATMTLSRKIALYLSSKYKWYNPRLDTHTPIIDNNDVDDENVEEIIQDISFDDNDDNNDQEPSIEVAWAYYEHMTLPRRLVELDTNEESDEDNESETGRRRRRSIKKLFSNANKKMAIATPGENKIETKLYSPVTTPINQLGDFGLGVGLYFGTLRALQVLLLLGGLLNIPNMVFFSSEEYSESQKNTTWHMRGSAACDVHEWVPCMDCFKEGELFPLTAVENNLRVKNVTNAATNEKMTFILKNSCDGAVFSVGMTNFGTVILLIVGLLFVSYYLKKKQVEFDIDEQTAQDYSITIHNPPKDAYDPEIWRKYFNDNFPECDGMHVTSCTVAVDNDELLDYLTKRREVISKLKNALQDDVEDVEDVMQLAETSRKIMEKSNIFHRQWAKIFGVPAMYKKLVQLNTEIKKLARENHPVTSVFVMFETEKAQRHVLENLTVSKYGIRKNDINALKDPKYFFGQNIVLDVDEAEEPSTIRWKELHLTTKDLLMKIFTTFVVFGIIVAVAFIIKALDVKDSSYAAMGIAVANIVFPQAARLITSFERHSREEHMQVWMYFKIAFFRWVNTAVVISFITPFTYNTLPGEKSIILTVYKIFKAEILTSTVIQLLDPVTNFKKHFIAPRAATQEKMNLHFRGSEIYLAERYTNLTKIVFLSLWFCPIYPMVLFWGSLALWVNYFLDRFSLMRTWEPQPKLGECISHYTRCYVFPVLILVMSFVARWYWGGFRFDYVCETSKKMPNEFIGTNWELEPSDDKEVLDTDTKVSITKDTMNHEFCLRDQWIKLAEGQEDLVDVYNIFSWVNVAGTCLLILGAVYYAVKNYYFTKYEPIGNDQNIPFRKVDSMTAYIPQVSSDSLPYPLIACNADKIKDCGLFEWEDPLRPYAYYDLTRDVKKLLLEDGGEIDESTIIFSRMEYWPHASRSRKL